MDNKKIGTLLRTMRLQNSLTQLQVAENLHISDKTVSKWERGLGLPDISMLHALSKLYHLDLFALLSGELQPNKKDGGNMKKTLFYHCPHCGNIITATSLTQLSCCGFTLTPLAAKADDELHHLIVEDCGDEWYLTTEHPMQKEHYISLIVYQMLDRMITVKLYPEQEVQLYLPKIKHGKFLFLCSKDGLFAQK